MKKISLMALLLTMFWACTHRQACGCLYSVIGMVSDGHGIVIQNGKKYINSKK